MGNEKRRSQRIMFTVLVSIRGTDPQGQTFEAGGRTITLNRHGARIQASRPLHTGQIIHVVNQNNESGADFRVVGPITAPMEKVGEWGIECIEDRENIWGIHFPPPEEGGDARALVECRKCRAAGLLPLSLVEVEVLETAGILSRHCARCGAATSWGYPEKRFELESAVLQTALAGVTEAIPLTDDRRVYPRNPAQVPARVRDFYGGVELIQTENLSREGFCFISEKNYDVGQGLLVVCPFSPSSENRELRARVIRKHPGGSPDRWLYGVCYVRQVG